MSAKPVPGGDSDFVRLFANPHLGEVAGQQPPYRDRAWRECVAGRPEAFRSWLERQPRQGWEDEGAYQLCHGAVSLYLHMLHSEPMALRQADAAFERAEQLFSDGTGEFDRGERLAAVQINRAMAARLLGRWDEAETAVAKALNLDPTRPSLWVHWLGLWSPKRSNPPLPERIGILQRKHRLWSLDRELRSALEVDGDLITFRSTRAWKEMRDQMLPPLADPQSAKVEF